MNTHSVTSGPQGMVDLFGDMVMAAKRQKWVYMYSGFFIGVACVFAASAATDVWQAFAYSGTVGLAGNLVADWLAGEDESEATP